MVIFQIYDVKNILRRDFQSKAFMISDKILATTKKHSKEQISKLGFI